MAPARAASPSSSRNSAASSRGTRAAQRREGRGRRVERGHAGQHGDARAAAGTSRQRTRVTIAERALAADQQRGQVVAGVVLQQPAEPVDDRAVGEHRLEPGDARADRAVAQRAACRRRWWRPCPPTVAALARAEVDARVEAGGARVRLKRPRASTPGARVDLAAVAASTVPSARRRARRHRPRRRAARRRRRGRCCRPGARARRRCSAHARTTAATSAVLARADDGARRAAEAPGPVVLVAARARRRR